MGVSLSFVVKPPWGTIEQQTKETEQTTKGLLSFFSVPRRMVNEKLRKQQKTLRTGRYKNDKIRITNRAGRLAFLFKFSAPHT